MRPKGATSLRLVATLGGAGLISGILLVGVYLFTAPYIEKNRAEALERAIYQVLPGAVTSESISPVIHLGRRADGSLVGYAIVAEGNGFQDTIRLIYGFDPEREVITGMAVLESRETPGLGDKIIADAEFHENFKALAVRPRITLVKKGMKTQSHEVDGITGATISSEAIVSILERSIEEIDKGDLP